MNSYEIVEKAVKDYWEEFGYPIPVIAFFYQKYDWETEWEWHEELISSETVNNIDNVIFEYDFCEGQDCVKDLTIVPFDKVTEYYTRNKIKYKDYKFCDDAISREDTIKAIANIVDMAEQQCYSNEKNGPDCNISFVKDALVDAMIMIKKLPSVNPESCIAKISLNKDMLQGIVEGLVEAEFGNYISRQDAIDTILSQPTDAHYPSWYADIIEDLPPVLPKSKEGHWVAEKRKRLIDETDDGPVYLEDVWYSCSNCGFELGYVGTPEDKYCKNCGCEMVGE